jgi:threonine synthase
VSTTTRIADVPLAFVDPVSRERFLASSPDCQHKIRQMSVSDQLELIKTWHRAAGSTVDPTSAAAVHADRGTYEGH